MDDSAFKKIDVSSPTTALPSSVRTGSKEPMRKRRIKISLKSTKAKVIFAVILVLVAFFGFTTVRVLAVVGAAKKFEAQAKVAYAAAKQQNISAFKEELVKTDKELDNLQNEYGSLGYLKFVPLASGYYSDGTHLLNTAAHGINAANITADSLIPYADVLGLKGDKSFVMGSAQDRIRLAINTLGKVVPKIDAIETEVKAAKTEIDQVNPNRYPNFGPFKKIHDQLTQAQTLVDQGALAVDQGKPLIKSLPSLLGDKEGKKYLVLFQNDKELRPTGGFITFYAIFRVEDGVIQVDNSSDIYDLDGSIGNHPDAPEIIRKYLPKVNELYIRDSNLSPDFVNSMDDFLEMYKESNGDQDIDGIVAIDTHFFVNILKILGEVQASGLTFNTETDKRCDCPQALYLLEDHTSRPVNYIRTNRKGLLGELLQAIMQKALSSSPKEYWGRLVQQGIKDLQEKHVLIYVFDKEAQKGIEALNWAGRIKPFEGDYLHINDANLGGQKSNMFVQQSVRVDYDIASSGEVSKKLVITYKNPFPHSDCNLERGGLCLNAVLRDFQRVYVTKGSTLDSSKGSEVKVTTKEDLGKTYFESFFTVRPEGKSEITYDYKLPFKLKSGSPLPVLIQKQPGTNDIPYEIYVNGKNVESFNLVSDKEFSIKR